MGNRIDKRLWGVLGKQQTFFSPQKQVEGKVKTPLNVNAFDSWDVKRSRFKRVDGYENIIQQGGVVPQPSSTPVVSPTPTTTPTPTITPTNTLTPTPTTTSTLTPTQTPTNTSTPTNTQTPTQTRTPTNTPTPSSTPPASGTTEANAYLTAVVNAGGTGITSTVSAATITLFTSLVSNGLYDKLTAFYPLLGGNSNGCKFNGKNPVDTNAGYRLTFFGGWTFNPSGATSNGTTAYADTFLAPSAMTLNSQHLGIYLANNSAPLSGKQYIGAAAPTPRYCSIGQDGSANWFYGLSSTGGGASSSSRQGMIIAASSGGTIDAIYRNGTLFHSYTVGARSDINVNIYVGCFNNNGSPQQYYANEYRFTTIGSGLTAAEVSTLSTIINTFQTTIGRNTY